MRVRQSLRLIQPSMDTERKDAVIIGAGISGLVCAYRLKTLGASVLIVESSDRVGGVMRSEVIDGYLIERGPNSSQGTEELLALVEELGIMNELAEGDPKAPAYIYFKGRLHPAPAGPGAFLRSKLLSASGKLRILKEPFIPARHSSEEESIAAFARRRIGHEAAERMVAPFVSGIYAGDAERLSAQAAFPRLANLETGYGSLFRGMFAKAREARRAKKSAAAVLEKAAPARRRLVSFKSGMGFLPKTLASSIGEDLMTGISDCRLKIGQPGEGFEAAFNRNGAQHRFYCERLIIAAPAKAAARLLEDSLFELSRLLEEIYYPPLSILCLSYDQATIRTPLDGFGFLVPPSERMNILGCVWNSSLFEGRAPSGRALITTFIGGARNPEAARIPDAELVALAHADLQKILGISSEPQIAAITRWERAIPQYLIGHAARVKEIERQLDTVPGLHLVGNYLHGVSTGDCIKEADRAARAIIKSLSPA
jgi:protoporphyrinogen/coproporphyrinogen III oxidase